MARVDELPADQRAALQLILKQGRSYEEIAQLLRIEDRAVRERARAALDALGPDEPEDLELDEQDDVADYLLGQQSASRRAETRELLESSAAARAWARVVAGELRPLAGDDLPEIPAEARETEEAFGALSAREAHREKTQSSSRVGGLILLVALGLLLAGAIALALSGGDDGDDEQAATTPATTAAQTTPSGQPQQVGQVNMERGDAAGERTVGVMRIFEQGGQRALVLQADGLPVPDDRGYGLWLRRSNGASRLIGFLNEESSPTPQRPELALPLTLPPEARDYSSLVLGLDDDENQAIDRIVLTAPLRELRGATAPAGAGAGAAQGGGGTAGGGG